jgi:hypothetical protein
VFSWLDPALLGHTGRPVHDGTAAALPGVWYIGQRWLTRRSSGNFLGFPADAATIATAVAATLRGRPGGSRWSGEVDPGPLGGDTRGVDDHELVPPRRGQRSRGG